MTALHPIPDAALDADIAILGKKGRGKTYTAKGIVERLLTMGRRVVVLDPLSVWWGLKANALGAAGFPIAVFGGPHGDMALTEEMGRPLARVLARENLPAVIDLGEMRKAAWQRLVGDMLDELFTVNRDPLWIVLEEADVFAPQQPREGDSARVLGEVDRIARRGRAYGFRLISITQRPARLHKDVLTQLSTLVALGITSPQDRDAIKAWVEGNADRDQAREVMDSLARLGVGEGWVWAPDHDLLSRVRFPPIRTLDTSATPKAGEQRVGPKTLAEVDLSAVRAALAAPPNDGALGSRAATRPAAPSDEALQEAYDRGLRDGEARGRASGMALAIVQAQKALANLRFDTADEAAPAAIRIAPLPAAARCAAAPAREPGPAPSLNSAARKILEVLDTDPPVRLSWTQAATLAGLRARGGHFNAGRKALLDGGFVIEVGSIVRIAHPSDAARVPLKDPGAMVERWAAVLSGAAPRLLRALHEMNGVALKEQIAVRLGLAPKGGHWNEGWKQLRDNDLVVERSGRVELGALLRAGIQ